MTGSYQAIRGVVLNMVELKRWRTKRVSVTSTLFSLSFADKDLLFCCPYRQQKKG